MEQNTINQLKKIANEMRKDIIEGTFRAGSGHPGGSLSCTDVMAYLGGMAYNKIRKGKAKKLAPHLSPKKTVAGALFGLIGGALGGLIVYYLVGSPANIQVKFFSQEVMFLLIGAICSVLTQVGDLFESYIKRQAGVKDSGKLLPGHGGILDRIDGTMFTAVFIYFLFTL